MKTKLTINCKQERITKDGVPVKESVNEDKFYNTRVQYTDPKSKKKFVGDVVRKDGDEYKVNLGKDGRFEKYILAKAKDLKIVSKSKKRTYESVNESKTKKQIHKEIRKQFYEVINEKFPQYDIDNDGFGRVQLVDGRNVIEYHMSRHTLCGYSDNSKQCHDDELEMEELLNEIVKQYNI